MIKLVIIEDDKSIQGYLSKFFSNEADFEVVGVCGSIEDFISLVPEIDELDIVLSDIGLPGLTGIDGIKIIKQHFPKADVVMQTIHTDNERVFAALCAGAVGYFKKNESLLKIKEGLLTVKNGGAPMSPAIARKVVAYFNPLKKHDSKETLTPKEMQVVEGLKDGLSYKLIGVRLNISVDTVRAHIRNIYKKLEVNSKSEVIAKSMRGEI